MSNTLSLSLTFILPGRKIESSLNTYIFIYIFHFAGVYCSLSLLECLLSPISLSPLQETRAGVEDVFGCLEEFHVVLNELVGDESMVKVKVEYEKLSHALKKSRENEGRLMSKCRELNAEIVETSAKVAAVLKLSQEDETTIASLKKVHCENMRG